MNSMNDERFFDLAMKVISRQATDAERAELDALLSREPDLRAEFARREADVRVAKEALPLVDAVKATAGEFPAYARERLQTKVRQTLGRPVAKEERDRTLAWGWRWVLGLAAAVAVMVLVALPILHTSRAPVIEIALLDTAGATRGADTEDVLLLREAWKAASFDSFTTLDSLRGWETRWHDKQDGVKIVYDRSAAEVRVLGKREGKRFEKTFPVEPDLPATLVRVKSFVAEEMHL
jgi:hypothetical protein